MFWLQQKEASSQELLYKSVLQDMIDHDFITSVFWTWRCESEEHVLNHINNWFRKWVVLRSSHFSEFRKKESMMHLCSLSSDENYKNHTSLNLTDEVWSSEKWTKTWVMMNSECTFTGIIDTEYMKKQQLNIWKLKCDMFTREFNRSVFWIMHYVIIKLCLSRHLECLFLYVHSMKNDYDIILEHKWLKWHNLWIDWIDETVKFDTQYCWSNCLHDLSWYVHTHDYLNVTWYELSMFWTLNLTHDSKKNFMNTNVKNSEKSFLRIFLQDDNHKTDEWI